MKYFNKTLLAVSIALVSSQTMASGFQSNSQSATGFGRAFAGDAVIADNASVLSRNPAAMALFDETSYSVGLSYIDIDISVKDIELVGMPPENGYGSVNSAGTNKFIPNFYYIQPINDKFAFGIGAFTNFATGTDAGSLANSTINHPVTGDPIPAPVDLLGNTEVTTMNFNASVSYRINEQFSVGAGIDLVYGQGTLTREGNLPIGPGGAVVPANLVDVDADGIGFGGIVGATYEIDANNRLGFSYRFSPEFKAEGDIDTLNTQLGAVVSFDEIVIPLPDIMQFAGFHQLNEKFAVHYTAQLTTWGDFDQITVNEGSVAGNVIVDEAPLKVYQWEDSWLFSVGGTYTINDKFTARAGIMKDQAVAGEISSISIPDSDRTWYTAGFSYAMTPKASIDFGLAVVRGEDATVIENSAIVGDISAHTRSDAVYYSLQYSSSF
ncbi:OmpP1/FadL family transporter [Shewanella gelidii]|nr:outer membrane protein transport protein [Shewanella gelidii]MCL1098214.1 outer membrane protein transport protein [Shewanella gelidii]